MRRLTASFRQIVSGFALLTALAATTGLCAQPFKPAPTALGLAHERAAQALQALQADTPEHMPRLRDPQAGPLLRTLSDAPRFLSDERAPSLAALSNLSDICDASRNQITAYFSAGALNAGGIDAAVVLRNVQTYQDELALLQPFLARCIAKQVPLAEGVLRQIGANQASRLRLGGLQRSHASLLQLYLAVAACKPGSAFGAPYCGLLKTMAELAPIHARGLPLASRAVVTDMLQPLLAGARGPRKTQLQRVLTAMADRRCTGVCLLGR